MFYNGTWGTVCDDHWTLKEANVVCRQLGFEGASTAVTSAGFGPGIGNIWMDGVYCVGNENTLAECNDHGWGQHNCDHSEDAGVICIPGNYRIRYKPLLLIFMLPWLFRFLTAQTSQVMEPKRLTKFGS